MATGNILNKALNIEKSEQTAVYLLLLQTFFLGIFFAIFDISSTAMFMDAFGEGMLSKAFLVSGVVGFLMTAAYSKLQSKIKFSKLIVINLLAISLITLLLRLGFFYTTSKTLIFIVFVMMGPLNLLGVVGFWGMAGRLFTLRQGKRLFGLIDAGQIIGMILISLSVPILLPMLKNNYDLLFVSSGSIFIAFFVQLIISNKFNLNTESDSKDKPKSEKVTLSYLIKNKYVFYMALFVVFSMLAAFFMFYSFLPTTKLKYPGDSEYTSFLGMFTASLMFFTLLIKTLAYNRLTKAYGLKVNLLLPAVILGIFTVIAIVVSSIFGFQLETTGFMLFFLLVSLGRLFSVSLKSSIEIPSQKILYQSLDSNVRHSIQVVIDGMVNEIAAIASGLFLLVLSLLNIFDIVHYSYFLLAIIVAWAYIGTRLYREYRKSLEVTLDKSKDFDILNLHDELNYISETISKGIDYNDINKFNVVLDYSKILMPFRSSDLYLQSLNSGKEEVSKLILKRIKNEQLYGLVDELNDYLKIEKNVENINEAKSIINNFTAINEKYKKENIAELINSPYPKDKIIAINQILRLNDNSLSGNLIILLRDLSPEVKVAAIIAAAKIKDIKFVPLIIDNLLSPYYNKFALETLRAYGNTVHGALEQFFYRSGLDENIQIQIIKLLADSYDNNTITFLLNKLNYHNRKIVIESCKSLQKCKYTARNDEEKRTLLQLLEQQIRITAWNINLLVNYRENEIGLELKQMIEKEVSENYNIIFLLLSIIYDPQSVIHVRENLESDTAEGINFALELLDIFIDESIKSLILVLFEDLSNAERVRQFQDFFPLDRMNNTDLLNAIINRDTNFIDRWTKALAVSSLRKIEDYKASDDVVAQLFSEDKLLSEIAAQTVYNSDNKYYESCSSRLDKQTKSEFDRLVINKIGHLKFEKVKFLIDMNIFSNISFDILIKLVEESREIIMFKDEVIPIDIYENQNSLFIISEGQIAIETNLDNRDIYKQNEIIPINKINDKEEVKFIAYKDSTIMILPFNVICKYINYFPELSIILSEIV